MGTSVGTGRADGDVMTVSVDADYATIGGLLLAPGEFDRVAGWLRPEDFARPLCGEIYALIADLRAASRPVDTVTVYGELRRQGRVRADGYPSVELLSMVESVPVAAMTPHYARQVLEAAVFRRLEQVGTRTTQLGRGRRGTPDDAFEQLGGYWADLADVRGRWQTATGGQQLADPVRAVSHERDKRMAGRSR